MSKEYYKEIIDLIEEGEFGKAFEFMEEEGTSELIVYIEIMNTRCRNCKANQCNYCNFYRFDTKFISENYDKELMEMGYLDENYNWKYKD